MLSKLFLTRLAFMGISVYSVFGFSQSSYELDRDHWIKEVKVQLPKEVCGEGQFFRTCYEITQQECLSKANTWLPSCLKSLALPPKVNSLIHGRPLGIKLGGCLAVGLEKEFREKKKDNPNCENRSLFK